MTVYKGYELKPQNVSDVLWYYEGQRGLTLVHELRDELGRYIRTDQIVMPWRIFDQTMKRRMAVLQRLKVRNQKGGQEG